MLTGSDNVIDTFWRLAQKHPDRPCVTDLDDPDAATITYGGMARRVAALAGGLFAIGVRAGDRIGLLLRNSPAYVETFLAIAAAGAVAVPLNIRLREPDYLFMLEDSGARALVVETDLLRQSPGLRNLDLRIVLADGSESGSLDDVRSKGTPLPGPKPRDPTDLLSLMYTSGTTGPPKAVMLTHQSWRSVGDTASAVLGMGTDEVVLHVAPLTHGAGFLLLPTLTLGGHNLLCRAFDGERTAEILARHSVTGTFLVPSMIRMLLDVLPPGWRAPADFRWLYYAGSPIQPETQDQATRAFDGRLVQSFAQMESPMFFSVLDGAGHLACLDEARPTVRSAGRVLPGVQVCIVDGDRRPVPTGIDGEITARAPQTMAGYWQRPEETSKTLAGGWLHTGDVGHLDESGYLYIVDRIKDMIVTGGSNVYAREVEEVLLTVPGVRDAAVIGLPDRVWGESVTAVLVADVRAPDTASVISACRRAIPGYRVPKQVFWVDELPRNAYGKVLKRQLRADLTRYEEPSVQ